MNGGYFFHMGTINKYQELLWSETYLCSRNKTVLWVALLLRSHHKEQQHCLAQLAENLAIVPTRRIGD